MDSKFDTIPGLSWYPWHTDSYAGITVLGESNYSGWEKNEEEASWLKSKDFTRNRISGPALNGQSDEPIYRNLERAVFCTDHIDISKRSKLWNSVAYYNLVQRAMSSIAERPSRQDFTTGWIFSAK